GTSGIASLEEMNDALSTFANSTRVVDPPFGDTTSASRDATFTSPSNERPSSVVSEPATEFGTADERRYTQIERKNQRNNLFLSAFIWLPPAGAGTHHLRLKLTLVQRQVAVRDGEHGR